MTLARARETYHHGNLAAALLDAARDMVRTHGADHLSLRAVAAVVGVSPSAAYHHFPDKDSLISGVGEALFDHLADLQEAALARVTGEGPDAARARLRALGRGYFNWALEEPNLFRLMFGGYCQMNIAAVDARRDQSRAWNLLKNALEDLYRHGVIRPSLRPYGEILTWSAVHGATSLIVEGRLTVESFETLLDAMEISLGIKNHE